MYLIPNTKVNQTTNGQHGSGYYWTALKAAATNYSAFGASYNYAWLGTVYSPDPDHAWCVGSDGGVGYSYCVQISSIVVAPAFNLDVSKITLSGTTINK